MTRRLALRGFSLVELAVVMVISGLALAGFARLFQTLQLEQALATTRERMEKIQQQLDEFADRHERFPCPLAPAAGPLAREPGACFNPDLKPGERDVAHGILPAAALSLSAEDARDGWGNLFTYAVSASLTKAGGMRGVTPPPGVIGVVNAYGDNLLDTPNTGRYVVISHGPDGAGGFTPAGVGIPCRDGTLSAKNCHAPADFVAAPWSTARGPFFFDNIVGRDGSRRQARLLEHVDACGRAGKYYAPERFYADKDGCVSDDKVYGACTIEASYMDHGGNSPFTGEWSEPPQALWPPAKTEITSSACKCEKRFSPLLVGTWELPLHHPDPPPTLRDDCRRAVEHESRAIVGDHCGDNPPALDIRELEWHYDFLATKEGKVWKHKGSEWKPDDDKGWSILPLWARDPDTGALVKAKAAAHLDIDQPARIRRIIWTAPLVEKNHKLTLWTCTRK